MLHLCFGLNLRLLTYLCHPHSYVKGQQILHYVLFVLPTWERECMLFQQSLHSEIVRVPLRGVLLKLFFGLLQQKENATFWVHKPTPRFAFYWRALGLSVNLGLFCEALPTY